MRRNTEAARHVGGYLQKRRVEKGMTQTEVANKLGKWGAAVSQIESGERALKADKIDAYAAAYGIGVTTLRAVWKEAQVLYPIEPITRNRKSATKVLVLEQMIQQLDGYQRERVIGYIQGLLEENPS